jgi:5-formyltetrahydrofolate cyclo-ligase
VTAQVVESPGFERASRISVYLSMPKEELSTDSVVRQALAQGKKVFVPYIPKSSELTTSGSYMEMFALRSQEDLDSLKRDSWGIPTLTKDSLGGRENAFGGLGLSRADETRDEDSFEGLDLVLMPGMAFDHAHGRLGHGKGFYDRFLQRYWEVASQRTTRPNMPQLGMYAFENFSNGPDMLLQLVSP